MKALITGASSGIGLDMARYLSTKKWELILVARSKDKLEEIQEQLEELNKIYQNIENYDGTENNQKELKNIEIKL